jgi:hypothetical protein
LDVTGRGRTISTAVLIVIPLRWMVTPRVAKPMAYAEVDEKDIN